MLSDFFDYFSSKTTFIDDCEDYIFYIDEILHDFNIRNKKIHKLITNNSDIEIIKLNYKKIEKLCKEIIISKNIITKKQKELNNNSQLRYNYSSSRIRNAREDLISLYNDIENAILEITKIKNHINYI